MDPDNLDVIRSLEELYEETEQWDNLREMVERQLDAVDETDEDELVRLYVQRARVNYEQFGAAEEAIEDYQRAFEIQQDSPRVVEALEELYTGEERWDDLVSLYQQQMQVAEDESRLVELHVDMARIHHEHLDDDDAAIGFLDTVLDLRPDHQRALDVL